MEVEETSIAFHKKFIKKFELVQDKIDQDQENGIITQSAAEKVNDNIDDILDKVEDVIEKTSKAKGGNLNYRRLPRNRKERRCNQLAHSFHGGEVISKTKIKCIWINYL